MLRSFSTLSCLESNLDQVIEFAENTGMQGVELRVDQNIKTLICMGIDDAEKIKSAFANASVKITDLALSTTITEYSKEAITAAKAGIDFALAVGANAIRIFVGNPWTAFSQKTNSDYDGIVKSIRELCDYSHECEIWLETHSVFSSGKSIAELLSLIDRPNVFALWDVIHTVEAHESVVDTVKYLGKKIKHVHIKDGVPQENKDAVQFIHTALSKGKVPIKDAICELDKIGYKNFYSLEWESPWRPELKGIYDDHEALLKAFVQFTSFE